MRRRALTALTAAGTGLVAYAALEGSGVVAAFGTALAVSSTVLLLFSPVAPSDGAGRPVEPAPEMEAVQSDVDQPDTAPCPAEGPIAGAPEGPRVELDTTPASWLSRWLGEAPSTCRAVSAHLWLRDGPGGTIRLLASAGPMSPDRRSEPGPRDALGEVFRTGVRMLSPVSTVASHGEATTLWRYALPVAAPPHVGVAAMDVLCDTEPDVSDLDAAAAAVAPMLAAALAIDVAREEGETSRTLLEMARDLSRMLSVEDVISSCLDKAMHLTAAATGSVMLLDEDTGTLRIAAARGLPSEVVANVAVGSGEGIAGWVLASGQPVLVEDLPARSARKGRHGVRSSLTVPISDEGGVLGVLNVGSRSHPNRFGANHMAALETLARQTAIAVRNARAVSTTRDLYFSSVRALALALETKDPFAAGATDRIVALSTALAERLHLAEDEAEAVRMAALLHDICMDMATDVVSARQHLSTVERGMLSMHPVLAAEILKQAPALSAVVPIVYHHHERYDGRGYVSGLSGEAIPIGARILAVADAYVAMTSDRPYRRAKGRDEALREMADRSGSQFDPAVVDTFVEILAHGERRAEA